MTAIGVSSLTTDEKIDLAAAFRATRRGSGEEVSPNMLPWLICCISCIRADSLTPADPVTYNHCRL